jgi:GTPase SAR1 family protein
VKDTLRWLQNINSNQAESFPTLSLDGSMYLIGRTADLKLQPFYSTRNSQGVVVYDVTNRASFNSVDLRLQNFFKHRGKQIPALLVGNKSDLKISAPYVVDSGMAKEFANRLGMLFVE